MQATPCSAPRRVEIDEADLGAAVRSTRRALDDGATVTFVLGPASSDPRRMATRAAIAGFARSLRVELPDRVEPPAPLPRSRAASTAATRLSGLAVVTGAAGGIGRALTQQLLERGMRVIGIDHDRAALDALAETVGDRFEPHEADLRTLEQLPGTDPIDLLVHSAGISCVGRFADLTLAPQLDVVAVNHEAPMRLTERALARRRLIGGVVFVSSLSHYVGYPGAAVYAATKDGLAAYASALREASEERQILTVFPGPTRTEHARRYSPRGSDPSRRMPPSEVAAAIVRALLAGGTELVPGGGNQALAWLGARAPRLGEWLMQRFVLRRLDAVGPEEPVEPAGSA